jgi:NADPH:quinone reductase-like Zn-dependent oxidoreductase
MHAAIATAYGDPVGGIEFGKMAEPPPPGPGEVLVGVEYAPVNPADILLLLGIYAVKPPLPSVVGNEGVGSVMTVGPGVGNVKVGDRVSLPLSSLIWRERMVVPAAGLVSLPPSADPTQLAMVRVNPVTAFLLLSEFKPLKAGDWVVQNGANSGVGRAVIAVAKKRGLRTINFVRRLELTRELKAAGADVVLVEGPDAAARIREAVGNAPVALGLDGLSGPHTGVLASVLSFGGTLVTYGAMSGLPLSLSPADLIFKLLTLTGFFMGRPQYEEKLPGLLREAGDLIATGRLQVPVAAIYPLSQIKEAIAHAMKGGKVLLQIAPAR